MNPTFAKILESKKEAYVQMGIEKARAELTARYVAAMLREGIGVPTVVAVTGLSEDEVNSIAGEADLTDTPRPSQP